MQDSRNVSPDLYTELRNREGEFICDICTYPWPVSHRRRSKGGLYVGVKCCYEPDGDEVARDLRRAQATRLAARLVKKEELDGLVGPDGVIYPGTGALAGSESIDYGGAITSLSPYPVVLLSGGSLRQLNVTGFGFTATDTFGYGTGIINAVPPQFVSSTSWILQVMALVVPPRINALTYNGTTVWQAVFDVR